MRHVLVLSTILIFGCSSADPPAPVEPNPHTVACTNYCDVAKTKNCPNDASCIDDCVALFAPACDRELKRFLSCAGPSLTEECVPRNPQGVLSCTDELADYYSC